MIARLTSCLYSLSPPFLDGYNVYFKSRIKGGNLNFSHGSMFHLIRNTLIIVKGAQWSTRSKFMTVYSRWYNGPPLAPNFFIKLSKTNFFDIERAFPCTKMRFNSVLDIVVQTFLFRLSCKRWKSS